jgi:uncharacterized protein with FMN-binding domain
MRRAILALTSTIAGLVLLLSFKTHSPVPAADLAPVPAGPGSGSPSPASSGPGHADGTGAPKASKTPRASRTPQATKTPQAHHAAAGGATTRTVTGSVANTPYGPMQVQVTLTGKTIAKVTVVQQTDDGAESTEIDAGAIPKLVSETLTAQSARIDSVTGATWTSTGYRQSLQAALDQASA